MQLLKRREEDHQSEGSVKTSPAFQFYPSDYLGSQRVQLLTLEEEGAYLRLLCHCWLHGSIPADETLCLRLLGKGGHNLDITTVLNMFIPGPSGRLVHDRLEAERRKQVAWREKSAEGGKKGARLRWEKQARKREEPAKFAPQQASLPIDNQPESKGYSQNGNNHLMTLQSSVFSLQSSDNKPSPNLTGSEEQRPPTEGSRFVDWFVKLLVETGAPDPKLTPSIRESWADCYDKLLRLDGRTKDEVKEVCRWARNDSFWRGNFMSPMKLRDKKDGVKYFDVFLNKMRNPVMPTNGNGSHGMMAPRIKGTDIYTEPADWRDRFARKYPDHTPPESWEKCSSTIRNAILAP